MRPHVAQTLLQRAHSVRVSPRMIRAVSVGESDSILWGRSLGSNAVALGRTLS